MRSGITRRWLRGNLLLPRLLADDAITAEDIARLGEGGLCLGCAECHWPNCGFGHC